MSAMNMRKILLDELKKANSMLEKYETKLLEGNKDVDQKVIQDGVSYWREAAQQIRKQLFETKGDFAPGRDDDET